LRTSSRCQRSSVAGVTTSPCRRPCGSSRASRGDERTIGGAKPRALLLASENPELVSQEHQFHVLGELGSSIADEQPQNSGKGKVGEGKEHRRSSQAQWRKGCQNSNSA
jgi:hypothetical protein